MPGFGIAARFPLGTYQGHHADGTLDDFPDTARLLSALINAACRGSLAVESGGRLQRSADAAEALSWMENHPPDGLKIPGLHRLIDNPVAHSWRLEGTLDKHGKDEKTLRRVERVALDGAMGWQWNQQPPPKTAETLAALCADVAYLGEAESAAVLAVTEVEPTHVLVAEATALTRTPGGIRVRTPAPGRVSALDGDYATQFPTKRPTVAAFGTSQRAVKYPVSRSGLTHLTYRRPEDNTPRSSPWNQVLLMAASTEISENDRITWCVALHRAIVAQLGDDAPGIITGHYDPGVTPTANRVAIQYLPKSVMALTSREGPAFAVLLPAAMTAAERETIGRAVRGVRRLYVSGANVHLGGMESMPGKDFWQPRPPGLRRLWSTHPAAVPECRPRQLEDAHTGGQAHRTFETAALISVGYLLRDQLPPATGKDRLTTLARLVRDAGVNVVMARPIADSHPGRYVHKVPRGMVVQPYRALLDLGHKIPETALVAIGQSRHLGGGLLVPVDLPEDIAHDWINDADS